MQYYNLVITIIYIIILIYFYFKILKLFEEKNKFSIENNKLRKENSKIESERIIGQSKFIDFFNNIEESLSISNPEILELQRKYNNNNINIQDFYKPLNIGIKEIIRKNKNIAKENKTLKKELVDIRKIFKISADIDIIPFIASREHINLMKHKKQEKRIKRYLQNVQAKDQKLLYYKRRAKKFIWQNKYNLKLENFIKTLAGENEGVNKKYKKNLKKVKK